MKQRIIRRAGVALGALALTGILAATAAAVITSDSGGAMLSVDKRTSNTPTVTSTVQWSDLPGASVLVNVPANQSRLYDVPFFAESQCAGPNTGGACSVRIIAVQHRHRQRDRAQSPGGDRLRLRQRHGRRARRPPRGPRHGAVQAPAGRCQRANYQIEVQIAVTDPTTVFTLDDWHLAVHTNV